MNRSLFALVLPVLAACSSTASNDPGGAASDPVVGGKADNKDHAVVAIEIGGTGLCTGTLIGPRQVLTARHCVSETAQAVSCPSTGAQIGADRDPTTLVIVTGADVHKSAPVARGTRIFTPPGKTLCEHDIAILELDRDVVGITPATVAGKGVLTKTTTLRAVGYGRHDDASNAGKRLQRGGIAILAETAHEFETGEATCSGDSGGPAFDEASGAIVGVVSRGAMPCASPTTHNVFTRTDAFAALIATALGAESTGAGGTSGAGGHPGHGHAGHGAHAGHGHAGHGHRVKGCFSDANCPTGQSCHHSTHVCG